MTWLKRMFWTAVVLSFGVAMVVWATWEPDRQLGALVARWAPAPSSFIELDGMQVHIRDIGPRDDPTPIVLLHGMASSLHTYEAWQNALKDKHRVISVDLPGFGLTGPSPQGEYRSEAYTRFVLRLLDSVGVQHVVLGGNALGGEVAWQTALLAPERVRKLILIDSDGYQLSPLSQPIAFQIAGARGLRWVSERILPRSIIESSVRNVYGDPDKVTQERVDRYFELALRVGNRRALFQRMDQSESGAKQHLIRQIKQPTLVLWGARDGMVPVEFSYRFCKDIPNCTLVLFPELGHIPQEEDAVKTLRPVLRFLARN
ncbi:MAG TPA: alpha/beta hydrolase [Aquabacterium sp.]|uniref:alpha/beta fold hydrolase n=1 Tax=Aquabacterium sp. TaxID=1872578 RepID=UPI002E32D3F3|nr:alpha/beta hydrolase [Aquabacterium sp.]HEX5373433.1 alpha/beta hydrolase [Aquabacterium sp.]